VFATTATSPHVPINQRTSTQKDLYFL
jgi:hypothetical protein